MREFMGLFRGKRIDNGEWVEGCLLKVTLNGETAYLIFGDNFSVVGNDVKALSHALVDPDTVGECTGLRDKNGKLAFEHHITVDQWGRRWVIFGCAGGFCICRDIEWTRNSNSLHRLYNALAEAQNAQWFSENHIIVGDLIDNPELLKGGDG